MIFGLDLTGLAIGSASVVSVEYEDGGRPATWRINHVMAVVPKGVTCDSQQAYMDDLAARYTS